MSSYFITAIDTDSGKTLVSAILVQALQADYWKPIQSGLPRDTERVQSLVNSPHSVFHPEAYLLSQPLSPHASAAIDGVRIDLAAINPPQTTRHLVIEGAGGVLVPLNDRDFVIDIAARAGGEVILVADLYLGSINHTLLTINELKRRSERGEFRVRGIIFNGDPVPASEEIILKHSGYECLLHITREETIDTAVVEKYAKQLSVIS